MTTETPGSNLDKNTPGGRAFVLSRSQEEIAEWSLVQVMDAGILLFVSFLLVL